MNYTNEICKGCNQPIGEDDDIVVCPVCGTPQHRACWESNSDCVNASLHSEHFLWQKSVPDEAARPEEAPQPEQPVFKKIEINTIPVFDQLAQEAGNLESAFLKEQIVNKEEEIDGIKISDIGYYLQSGAYRYIRRFRKGRKVTWNWGAFFFAPAWFFFRRLYKPGAIFLSLIVSINLFSYSFLEKIDIQMQEVYTVMEQFASEDTSSEEAAEALMSDRDFMEKYTAMVKNMSVYLLITAIIPNTVAALIADLLVKKKMKADVKAAREASDDTQMQRSLMISKGGVAPLVFAIVYFANQYIVSILISIGSMISEWFN